MKHSLLSMLLLGSATFAVNAAPGILSQKNLSLDLADQLAQSVVRACAKDHYTVSVTVVDRAGTPLVMKRMDNAGPHTLEASRMKAFTSLTTKNPTEYPWFSAAGRRRAREIRGSGDWRDWRGGCTRWASGSGLRAGRA